MFSHKCSVSRTLRWSGVQSGLSTMSRGGCCRPSVERGSENRKRTISEIIGFRRHGRLLSSVILLILALSFGFAEAADQPSSSKSGGRSSFAGGARKLAEWRKQGFTLLMIAAGNGKTDLVKAYLERGDDVNAKSNEGFTALMLGCTNDKPELVTLLLHRGAAVNASANNGATALMQAASLGNIHVVKLLLSRGADVNARTPAGVTALSLATSRKHKEVVKILRQHGARR